MPPNDIHLTTVGDECGKTSLLTVYVTNKFPVDYIPKQFPGIHRTYEVVDGKEVSLIFFDTISHEDYDKVRPFSYPYTDVIVMCFSIGNPQSLENISTKWIPEVKRYLPQVPIVFVGNKKDLRHDNNTRQELSKMNQEPVKTVDAQAVAEKIGAFEYLECSAKTKEGVREVFETAARAGVMHVKKIKSSKCTIL